MDIFESRNAVIISLLYACVWRRWRRSGPSSRVGLEDRSSSAQRSRVSAATLGRDDFNIRTVSLLSRRIRNRRGATERASRTRTCARRTPSSCRTYKEPPSTCKRARVRFTRTSAKVFFFFSVYRCTIRNRGLPVGRPRPIPAPVLLQHATVLGRARR